MGTGILAFFLYLFEIIPLVLILTLQALSEIDSIVIIYVNVTDHIHRFKSLVIHTANLILCVGLLIRCLIGSDHDETTLEVT